MNKRIKDMSTTEKYIMWFLSLLEGFLNVAPFIILFLYGLNLLSYEHVVSSLLFWLCLNAYGDK